MNTKKDYKRICKTKVTKDNINVYDMVKPASKEDAGAIAAAFNSNITTDTELEVLYIVHSGQSYTRKESGIIVRIISNALYQFPYVWDFKRFVK